MVETQENSFSFFFFFYILLEAAWSSGQGAGGPEFKSRSDHLLDLFEVVRGSSPRLRLYITYRVPLWLCCVRQGITFDFLSFLHLSSAF